MGVLVLEKIISGGQHGADRAGLEAAAKLGFQTGGTAPKGFRVCTFDGDDSTEPALAELGLVEHASRDYPPRTRQNVVGADGTAWFGFEGSPGGKLTIFTARTLGKPLIVNPTAQQLREWAIAHSIRVLNVAGNRESRFNPDITLHVYSIITEAFS